MNAGRGSLCKMSRTGPSLHVYESHQARIEFGVDGETHHKNRSVIVQKLNMGIFAQALVLDAVGGGHRDPRGCQAAREQLSGGCQGG